MINYYVDIRKNKRDKIWLFLIILFLCTLLLKLFPPDFKAYPLLNQIVVLLGGELFSTLLPLVTFTLFYQIYTENEDRKIARQDIIESIYADKESLNLFTKEAKIGFIKSIVCSVIGTTYGQLLFKNLIQVYLKDDVLYRKDFKYDVELSGTTKNFSFKGMTTLSPDNYYSLNQNIIYSKHFNKEVKDIDFKIVFAFDDKSLDHWMNDDYVFFREVLQIDEWRNDISNYSENDFTQFIEKCLSLKLIFFNDKKEPIISNIIYNVNYVNSQDAKGIELLLKDKKAFKKYLYKDESSIYYRCKLSFKMPFSKKINRFHFVLPEPTINPVFTIRFDGIFKNIDYFSYLAISSKKLKVNFEETVSTYSISTSESTSEIIYPRSGAIFFLVTINTNYGN